MELGNQYTQLGDKDSELATGGGADNQEGGLVENGTEEIEIAEMVDEEGGGNQMMIIAETKPDGQVCMSHVMRKPAFCICEKKGADQLRLINAFVFAS